jgi:hypothetical protein
MVFYFHVKNNVSFIIMHIALNLFFMDESFLYKSVIPVTVFPLFPLPGKNTQLCSSLIHGVIISLLLLMVSLNLSAQDRLDMVAPDTVLANPTSVQVAADTIIGGRMLTSRQIRSRVRFVAISNFAEYSALLIGLNAEWYSDYPRSGFHFFNDNEEWLQVDKVGHLYSAYIESRMSMELWRWTGIDRKKRIWYGGLSGAFYQTAIEVLDGFSAQWGWSWTDFGANILGSGALIAQELAWDDQRIKLKFSFHRNNYGDPGLDNRADKIFGKTITERFIKDYNAQTYWASMNLRAFFPKSNLPPWLSVAVGYGAEGMYGARSNLATDDNGEIIFDRRDIKRYRQWYLSPDIDLSKIKTNRKGVRVLLTVLSAFKFPAPSLEFSKGKFKVNAIHF